MEFDTLLLGRLLTFITLAFHISFATFGVGIPFFISFVEWFGIRKKDHHYIIMARRWTRGYIITVAVGVVTGTIIGLQLSLLWPSFMQLAGKVIALPLFMETFAFFFEAIFLGIYAYTWDRFKNPIYHWLLSLPIVLGAAASAFFITTVNAFMNTPQGFTMENGVITHIQPLIAMFNPATPSKVAHVLVTAYLTSGFGLAAVAAFLILQKKQHAYYKKALNVLLVSCLIFAVLTAVVGDWAGKFLAEYQPEKLAAAEWHFVTEERAKLVFGGILDENNLEVHYGISVPLLLSILAFGRPDARVIGLNDIPRDAWPPLYIHYFFDLMVLIGVYLIIVPGLYLLFLYLKKQRFLKALLWPIVLGGPLAMLAIESGWIMAEVGRQPWIMRGYMRTSEGVTSSPHVGEMLILFTLLYMMLGIMVTWVLIRLFKNNPAEEELEKKKIIL
ncbi:MAG: cytochrome ubiquinol oxidase subunit I [Clostridia bacterium]